MQLLEVSGAVRPLEWFLGVNGLIHIIYGEVTREINYNRHIIRSLLHATYRPEESLRVRHNSYYDTTHKVR